MAGRETNAFDRHLMLAMRERGSLDDPIGGAWLEELARDLTALGSFGVLLLVTVSVLGYLALKRAYRAAALLLAASAGGWLLSIALKGLFARPRPALVAPLVQVYSTSFPSGHAFMSAATYLTMAAMLARMHPGPQPGMRRYLFASGALVTVLVGVTRVYLGVHWPTDVLAGWGAGAAWALLCWLVVGWLQRRGQLEKSAARPR